MSNYHACAARKMKPADVIEVEKAIDRITDNIALYIESLQPGYNRFWKPTARYLARDLKR